MSDLSSRKTGRALAGAVLCLVAACGGAPSAVGAVVPVLAADPHDPNDPNNPNGFSHSGSPDELDNSVGVDPSESYDDPRDGDGMHVGVQTNDPMPPAEKGRPIIP